MGKQTGENENLVNGDKRKIGPFEVGPLDLGAGALLIRISEPRPTASPMLSILA